MKKRVAPAAESPPVKRMGRPRKFKDGVRNYQVTLPPRVADAIAEYGGGNVSAGMRRLAKEVLGVDEEIGGDG